ncbi:MAG: hypothetical protein JW786_01540 [Desulfobacterales bacterium]|nr:hypothetical protein [Desulfobacterales bacterium]
MDIRVAIDHENAKLMAKVLKEFGFDTPQLSEDLFLEEDKIIRMGVAPMRIEILTSISGVKFDECYQKKVVDEIDGIQIAIISLEHLKINKKASGRPKPI